MSERVKLTTLHERTSAAGRRYFAGRLDAAKPRPKTAAKDPSLPFPLPF